MNDAALYSKMTTKSRKRAVNPNKLKFKPLDEIKTTLEAKVADAIGVNVPIDVEVDPDHLNHYVAAKFKCNVDNVNAKLAKEAFAEAFDVLVYAVSAVPDYYDSNMSTIIYDVMSDAYVYKPVLGRDY